MAQSLFSRAAHAVDLLLAPSALRIVAFAGLIGGVLGLAIFIARMPGAVVPPADSALPPTRHLGGDFLNFYTAGRMIITGDGARLYDLRAQLAAQRTAVGYSTWNGLAAYINPPALALACAPFAALPYKAAYAAASFALLAIFLAGLRALRPQLPGLATHWDLIVALGLLFYPFARTITGGQNTAVSFALMAAAYAALRRAYQPPTWFWTRRATPELLPSVQPGGGQVVYRRAEAWAGLWLGLLFYKPQLALVFCLLLALRGLVRPIIVAVLVGATQYVLGALVAGPNWPASMSACLSAYWPLEFQHNGAHLVSWLGFCEYALPRTIYKPVGLLLMAATFALLIWTWRRAHPARSDFGLHWGLAVCATVLISPHTQWYDAGLVLLPVLLALEHVLSRTSPQPTAGTTARSGCGLRLNRRIRVTLAAGFVFFPIYLAAPQLGFQPLVILPLAGFLWLLQLAEPAHEPVAAGARGTFEPAAACSTPLPQASECPGAS